MEYKQRLTEELSSVIDIVLDDEIVLYGSNALLPPATSPKGMTMTEEAPPLHIQAFPPCFFRSFSSSYSNPLTHVPL